MAKNYLFHRKTETLREIKESIKRLPKKDEALWIDIHESKDDFLAIKDLFKLHPLTVDDCLKKETRIKIEVFDNYLLLIVYGINVSKGGIHIQEVDFILGKNFLITNHLNDVESIIQLQNDPKTLQKLLNKGPEFIVQYIMDRLIESFFPAIEKIDEEIDSIETKIFQRADANTLARLFRFKQHVMDLKRHTGNHREVIGVLAKRTVPFLSLRSEVYFRDLYDKVIRVSEFIETQREIVANIVETHTIVISNKMNEVIKVLTVITTIATPMTVIGTIYGMNFDYMPELHWKWSYPIAWIVMLILTAGMVYYFKKKDWF